MSPAGYAANNELLRDWTTLLRLKLHREVKAVKEQRDGTRRPLELGLPDCPGDAGGDEIAAFDAAIRQRVSATDPLLPASRLAGMFGLSEPARDLLLMLLVSGLDDRFGRVFAYLHEDAARCWLTPGLAWRLLGLNVLSPEAQALFTPDSPLLVHELVRLPAGDPALPLAARPLTLDDRIAAYLMGLDVLDERIRDYTTLIPPAGSEDEDLARFDHELRARLTHIGQVRQQDFTSPVSFKGPRGAGKLTAARYVAGVLGRPLLVVDVPRIPQALAGAHLAWRHVQREQRLRGAVVYGRHFDTLDEPVRQRLAQDAGAGMIFGAESDLARWDGDDAVLVIEFPVPQHRLRSEWWRRQIARGLGDGRDEAAGALADELAGRFRLTPGQIERAAWAARQIALLREGQPHSPARDDYFEGARRQSATNLDSMATKVVTAHTWDDLVLPAAVQMKLKAILSQVRNASTVYEKWGFAAGESTGKGLAALFSGPSGTGKTMSAGVIARALGLDMYKIDLARVVSKYIGETEKNLDRVFSEAAGANAVLFFDEADALFGKRSEVKDAHDRYANIEISYLLQKMEEYDGLAVLATNFGQNLDEAFNRRLHFIIEFPLPNAADRARIWRNHVPPGAPVANDIDFEFLASQFELTGGSIRNCVRAAAFAAADAGVPIGMDELVQAVAGELAKLGRPLQRADFGRYFGSVTDSRRGRALASNGNGRA
jgi:ATPase family protein associated with various cellular activities (AAA)/winged helix domain-containing protein